MHARTTDDPGGRMKPVIVLVHGLVISSSYMVPLLEHLSSCGRVFAVDLPGYGQSWKPLHAPSVREAADALADWADAMQLPPRISPGIITGKGSKYFTHDCSTLGGSSGSIVMSLETGYALGLHYGGSYLVDNYAVSAPLIAKLLADLSL
jgi:pimeloyl-ACP methyl ester carboxylesterase